MKTQKKKKTKTKIVHYNKIFINKMKERYKKNE